MTKGQNGARIKAFAGPNVGSGIVKNVTFENMFETAVDHPVIIDQVRFAQNLLNLFFLTLFFLHQVLSDKRNSLYSIPFKYIDSRYLVYQARWAPFRKTLTFYSYLCIQHHWDFDPINCCILILLSRRALFQYSC